MYAMLIVRREWKLMVMGSDGRWTTELGQERARSLEAQREAARTRYEAALMEHETALARVECAQEARLRWEASWESRLSDFIAQSRIEPLPLKPGFVRVTMPSGETLQCRRDSAPELIANTLKRSEPPPVIPRVGEPPVPPTERGLPQADAADSEIRQTLAWTARLTTQEADIELGSTAAEPGGAGPSPRFVTETLNSLAADSWTVQHVGEDRAMINESAELVRVRYLLVAP